MLIQEPSVVSEERKPPECVLDQGDIQTCLLSSRMGRTQEKQLPGKPRASQRTGAQDPAVGQEMKTGATACCQESTTGDGGSAHTVLAQRAQLGLKDAAPHLHLSSASAVLLMLSGMDMKMFLPGAL